MKELLTKITIDETLSSQELRFDLKRVFDVILDNIGTSEKIKKRYLTGTNAAKVNLYLQEETSVPNSFGWAINQLKAGNKVRRKGWNGKGMWIALMPPLYLDKDIINGRTKNHIGDDVDLDSQAYLVMWTAEGKWQPGWLASQADMLAEDWELV